MEEWISKLEEELPEWLEQTQVQWIQWAYALWQLVRCNPLTLLVLSFLPFYFAQRRKKKAVVVLGSSQDYNMSVDEMNGYFANHSMKNLKIETKISVQSDIDWFAVKHHGYVYLTHQNAMCELAKCWQLFGENVIFVERLLTVTRSLGVGKKLSQTEAYEKILSKRYHCSRGTRYVVPTFLDYVDLNSKIWGVLSTIPILLQARSYGRLSTLLSLVIIILDCNRGWLYKIYDNLFERFAKLVKIRVFKRRTALYDFCSIFSSRWKYSDTVKKCSYIAKPGETLTLRWYNKLESLQDIKIYGWERYLQQHNAQHICMEIVKDRASCSLMDFNSHYAKVTLQRPIYVS